jgi:hypothetical protein
MNATTTIVRSQAEIDAALANPTITRIAIDSPEGVWLTYITDRDIVADITGNSCVDKVTGRVDWVTDSGRVGRVTGSGRVGRVTDSGRVDWVDGSGRVGRVTGSGRVDAVTGSGSVDAVTGSGSVGRVDGSGSVGRVTGSGRVDAVTGSGRVVSAAGTSTIHMHGGTIEHAAPHVAVFLHSAAATVTGGHLIDLTQLDLSDVEQWRAHVGADHAVNPNNKVLVISAVSSEDHPGKLNRAGQIDIGCWHGTPTALRTLVHGDRWPSGADEEIREQYRPRILAFADLCQAQVDVWAKTEAKP